MSPSDPQNERGTWTVLWVMVIHAIVPAFFALMGFSGQNLSTPTATVDAFLRDLESLRIDAAAYCLASPNFGAVSRFRTEASATPFKLRISDVTLDARDDGRKATVHYTATFSAGEAGRNDAHEEKGSGDLRLARIADHWLILSQDNLETEDLLGSFAFFLSHPVGTIPNHQADAAVTKDRADRAPVRSDPIQRLKLLTLSALICASDHDDVFAFNGSNFMSKLRPYVKSEEAFFVVQQNGFSRRFIMNDALAGTHVDAIPDPARTVLFYDGNHGVLRFVHNGKALVGFVDGHVKFVSRAEAKKLTWNPFKVKAGAGAKPKPAPKKRR